MHTEKFYGQEAILENVEKSQARFNFYGYILCKAFYTLQIYNLRKYISGAKVKIHPDAIKTNIGRIIDIHHFHIDHNTLCLPPKVCIAIASKFYWA